MRVCPLHVLYDTDVCLQLMSGVYIIILLYTKTKYNDAIVADDDGWLARCNQLVRRYYMYIVIITACELITHILLLYVQERRFKL